MKVIVNGEAREMAEGATVEDLIDAMGLQKAICAAEVNKGVVAKGERGQRRLSDGDVVEIVTLVGGG